MPWLQKTKLCAEAMGLVVSLLDGKDPSHPCVHAGPGPAL